MRFLVIFLLFSCSAQQIFANPIKLNTIIFEPNARIRSAVKSECGLPAKLTGFIKEYAAQSNFVIADNAAGNVGKVLSVKITEAIGGGGGMWSGGKGVEVQGELTENGRLIGSFTASRITGGGFFGEFKGTCSLLGRCVKALGKDIAAWLKAPTMNDILGDGTFGR